MGLVQVPGRVPSAARCLVSGEGVFCEESSGRERFKMNLAVGAVLPVRGL